MSVFNDWTTQLLTHWQCRKLHCQCYKLLYKHCTQYFLVLYKLNNPCLYDVLCAKSTIHHLHICKGSTIQTNKTDPHTHTHGQWRPEVPMLCQHGNLRVFVPPLVLIQGLYCSRPLLIVSSPPFVFPDSVVWGLGTLKLWFLAAAPPQFGIHSFGVSLLSLGSSCRLRFVGHLRNPLYRSLDEVVHLVHSLPRLVLVLLRLWCGRTYDAVHFLRGTAIWPSGVLASNWTHHGNLVDLLDVQLSCCSSV